MTLEDENRKLKQQLDAVKKAYDLLEKEAKSLNEENKNLWLKIMDNRITKHINNH